MYKLVVNVSGKRARIVPKKHALGTAEREFGDLSVEEARANREGLDGAVRDVLRNKGISDAELYTVELPDALRVQAPSAPPEEENPDDHKGPVTKPKNPKKGELNSAENKPETEQTQEPVKPKEEETPPKPNEDLTKTSEQQAEDKK